MTEQKSLELYHLSRQLYFVSASCLFFLTYKYCMTTEIVKNHGSQDEEQEEQVEIVPFTQNIVDAQKSDQPNQETKQS